MRPRRPRPALRLVLLLAAAGLVLAVPPAARQAEAKEGRKGKQGQADVGEATDGEPSEAAAELDALGKAAYRKKRWDDAIAAFESAYEADPLPKYLFNLARCHEKNSVSHMTRWRSSGDPWWDAEV